MKGQNELRLDGVPSVTWSVSWFVFAKTVVVCVRSARPRAPRSRASHANGRQEASAKYAKEQTLCEQAVSRTGVVLRTSGQHILIIWPTVSVFCARLSDFVLCARQFQWKVPALAIFEGTALAIVWQAYEVSAKPAPLAKRSFPIYMHSGQQKCKLKWRHPP